MEAKDPESDPVRYSIVGGNEDEHFQVGTKPYTVVSAIYCLVLQAEVSISSSSTVLELAHRTNVLS